MSRKTVSMMEHETIKRAAIDRSCRMNGYTPNKALTAYLISGSEWEHQYTMMMDICECYDYWVSYFNGRLKQLRAAGRIGK